MSPAVCQGIVEYNSLAQVGTSGQVSFFSLQVSPGLKNK